MSSTEGLRELTNEISSLLSEGPVKLAPLQNGHESPLFGNSIPTLALPTLLPPSTTISENSRSAIPTVHTSTGINTFSTPGDNRTHTTSLHSLPGSGKSLTTTVPQLTRPMTTETYKPTAYTPSTGLNREGSFMSSISNDVHLPQVSTKSQAPPTRVNEFTNDQGHGQYLPTSQSIFAVNGVSGSGLSSEVSSLSLSARSSFSNLQQFGDVPGIEYGNKTSTELGTRTSDTRQDLGSQVKAHAQTIDILVSEKTALQAELSTLKAQLSTKTKDCTNFRVQLREFRQKIEEMQRERSALSEDLSRSSKTLAQSRSEHREASKSVSKVRGMLEDVQQENTELISKITSQSAELTRLQNTNTDLQSKLNMAELLTQQLSSGSMVQPLPPQPDPSIMNRLAELEGETNRLHGNVHQLTLERDQAYSDLRALRESLIEQQEDQATKMSDVQSKLVESELLVKTLKEQLDSLQEENGDLKRQIATEHAQTEHTSQAAVESAQSERDALQRQLDSLTEDNSNLTRVNAEQETHILELEVELSRLKEQSVDQQSLLTTIAQDKEAVSRAVSQNKELKTNIIELQDAFVRLSQQNMELASDLETEKLRVAQLKIHPSVETEGVPLQHNTQAEMAEGNPLQQTTTTYMIEGYPLEPSTPIANGEKDTGVSSNLEEQQMQLEVLQMEKADLQNKFVQLESDHGSLSNQFSLLQEDNSNLSNLEEQQMQLEVLQMEKADLQNKFVQLESDHGSLSNQFSLLQEDNSNLSDQLVVLRARYANLSEEHQSALLELESRQEPKEEREYVDYTDFDVHNMSADELTMLQHNFNALQQKFVHLVSEKVGLLEKLQENEHLIIQLSHETETIGDYITLYQAQRDALKKRFKEKDDCIEHLMQEKTSMQTKIHELQALVRQVLSERSGSSSAPPPIKHPPSTHHTSTPSKPSTPSDLPVHLRPQPTFSTDNDELQLEPLVEEENRTPLNVTLDDMGASTLAEDMSHMTFGSSQVTIEGDSFVSTATTEQILHLLDELDSDKPQTLHIPCRVCVGPVLHV